MVLGFFAIIAIVAVIIVVLATPFYFIQKYSCRNFSKSVGKETQFNFWGGGEYSCLVKIDGEWIPRESWIKNTGK